MVAAAPVAAASPACARSPRSAGVSPRPWTLAPPIEPWLCGLPPVIIRASDKEDPNDGGAKVWFEGQVDLNDTYDIDATIGHEPRIVVIGQVQVLAFQAHGDCRLGGHDVGVPGRRQQRDLRIRVCLDDPPDMWHGKDHVAQRTQLDNEYAIGGSHAGAFIFINPMKNYVVGANSFAINGSFFNKSIANEFAPTPVDTFPAPCRRLP